MNVSQVQATMGGADAAVGDQIGEEAVVGKLRDRASLIARKLEPQHRCNRAEDLGSMPFTEPD